MDLSVTLFAYLGFVTAVLAVCGLTYRYAEPLEAWAKQYFGQERE